MKKNEDPGAEPKTERYMFFSHRDCEYFPCHGTGSPEDFNCLFCYCPLYALGDRCGGNFTYTASGIKSCSHCLIPHRRGNYGYILRKLQAVMPLAGEKKEEQSRETDTDLH